MCLLYPCPMPTYLKRNSFSSLPFFTSLHLRPPSPRSPEFGLTPSSSSFILMTVPAVGVPGTDNMDGKGAQKEAQRVEEKRTEKRRFGRWSARAKKGGGREEEGGREDRRLLLFSLSWVLSKEARGRKRVKVAPLGPPRTRP